MPPDVASPAPVSSASAEPFDGIVERLRRVVDALESGKLTLEQSLEAFEQGVRLARRGNAVLDEAERRVELLTRGSGEEAADAVVPFDGATAADAPSRG